MDGKLYIHCANSFVDWMAGDSNRIIVSRPRRYVYFPPDAKDDSEDMMFFMGGG